MVALKDRASQHVGIGLYSMADAARLLHVHPSTLRHWVSQISPLVPRRLPVEEHAITFAELMELHFIKMFRSEGVPLQTIRKASKAAAERFSTTYPFSVKRFDTDGRTIFATMIREERGKVVIEDLKKGQYVFDEIVKPFFKKLEFRGTQDVVRFWPLEKKGRVVLDPKRKFGKPIDAESGIPTKAIYDAICAGGGQDAREVAKWLEIPIQAVHAAIAFEQSLGA
ncbi:MAG TPA: MerR family transcriptional regulator [Pirellulales bacterium]|nr:MerR family transcriptional regulator [Pirellulales bacterium]